ncbi:MAG: ABC transporter permease subunit, partial [Lachnospiraceae bacterium]|nr:ABC transporter permease subunit [Lachnospiraceae bacterium]
MVEFYFKILPYLTITITYVFFSLLFGFLLGALTAYFRLSKNRILNGIAGAYITVMRCVPSIVFLFLVYYGLPGLMRDRFGIDMNDVDAIVYVIITFSIMLGSGPMGGARIAPLTLSDDESFRLDLLCLGTDPEGGETVYGVLQAQN